MPFAVTAVRPTSTQDVPLLRSRVTVVPLTDGSTVPERLTAVPATVSDVLELSEIRVRLPAATVTVLDFAALSEPFLAEVAR